MEEEGEATEKDEKEGVQEESDETKNDQETDAKKTDALVPEAIIDLAGEEKEKEIRALHKTSSIFLRNLAPSITKAEVEAVSLLD